MNKHILPFSTNDLKSFLIGDAKNYRIEKNSIVINLSNSPLQPLNKPSVSISPWRSLLLPDHWIVYVESIVVIKVIKNSDLQEICQNQWKKYSDINDTYPAHIPLYISPQYSIGKRYFNPWKWKDDLNNIHNNSTTEKLLHVNESIKYYEIKLNLWFAPAGTNCLIHRLHPFLELHTQVYGKGHMQKFKENDFSTLYEDVVMNPGYTHDPFFIMMDDNHWEYPWHQYYSETDCIWMAIELYPV